MTCKSSVISAGALCIAAALSACTAAPSATEPAHVTVPPRATVPPRPTAAPSAQPAPFAFAVAGVHPVPPNGSQDTSAQAPGATCDGAKFSADKALGSEVAGGFALAGFPASADLLEHFLDGKGTEVDYPAGSAISRQARESSAFQAVNNEVQEAILGQLRAGRTRVRLSAGELPTVQFESKTSDLYWGFRGTQGLDVTGSGGRENGRYVGVLRYVIRDSYGFPLGDTLGGFGPPMRYLQTACGAPQHAGGAHWFPDTITVTVSFSQPA